MDREQVLAYRIAAQGLHRDEPDAAKLTVFDLGVQDSPRDTALLALAARQDADVTEQSLVDDPRLVLAWTHRGAPHFHRTEDLPGVIAALIPLDESDAMARMAWQRKQVEAAGMTASDILFTAARAMRKAVGKTMTKGTASTAVTKLVPESFSYWCRGCQATHILEQLMRLAAPHGGIRLVAGASPATLTPLEGRAAIRTKPDPVAAARVITQYLRVHGPATMADVAGFVNTTGAALKPIWPDDLAEVDVDGKRVHLPAEHLAELENPPEPDLVRLLPPLDPFLQSRDRALLLPDKARQKEVWKILGNPGVVLAEGGIAGTWRAKASGRKRLDFTLTTFTPLPPATRNAAESEAERVATTRGFPDLRVSWI
ncbi:MAG: hypothetical protein JWQ81_2828 [Amycolatopsis sp.]|uniref:winged helix DNA-binding domain-containing protein n=1 Tax=Amycolatopsis sp. TaxID=37632 RepID=UPI0026154E31|nr:winged helix DNA-binding domain-containing protein [Amycolatopsis sp.]MCU1682089.1 hypothetical protein [Amycolatopsis sp.]